MGEKQYTLLIADDEETTRLLAEEIFRQEGYTVVCASNGAEAWQLIQKQNFDLIMLDIKMPEMHGLEVLTKMNEKQMSTPVILHTAYTGMADYYEVTNYPNCTYLTKPVFTEKLIKTVKRILTQEESL